MASSAIARHQRYAETARLPAAAAENSHNPPGSLFARAGGVSSSLDRYLRRLRHPRWVPHISTYCDSRCEHCAFTERCWTFAVRQGSESDDPDEAPAPADEYESKVPRAKSWIERMDIDLENIKLDPIEEREYEERRRRIDSDDLVVSSRAYLDAAIAILRPHLDGEASSPDLGDLYSWALTIGVKTYRAISSLELDKDGTFERHPVQNDANGSAKLVRLCIQQSLEAWARVSGSLVEPGLVRHLSDELQALDSSLERRFPMAMAFVRPGFDEEVPGLVRPWSLEEEDDEE